MSWRSSRTKTRRARAGTLPTLQLAAGMVASPTCPRCGARMLLTRIFPDRLGYDTRIYECPQCEHEVTENPEYKKAG